MHIYSHPNEWIFQPPHYKAYLNPDYSVFKHDANVTSSLVNTDAKLTQIRKQVSNGLPTSFAMGEGIQLTFEGRELVNLYGQQGTVMRDGNNVSINGSISYFRIYAPSASSVKLNGNLVAFVQVGDYVEPPHVTVNRTWFGNISSQHDIVIDAGVTLTIQAGAMLTFGQGVGVISQGRLLAVGTPSQPIRFTSASPSSTWSGVTLYGSRANGSRLENLNVDRVYTNKGSAVSVIEATNVAIQNCNISNNVGIRTNALFLSSAGSPDIGRSTFNNNPGRGVYFYNTNGLFYGNVVKYNVLAGVQCSYYSSPQFGVSSFPAYLGNNTIKGNWDGVSAETYSYPLVGFTRKPWFGYNDIDSTSGARIRASSNSGVIAQRCWWGSATPDPAWFVADGSSWIDWSQILTSDPTPSGDASCWRSKVAGIWDIESHGHDLTNSGSDGTQG